MNIPDSILEQGICLKDQFFDLRGLSAYSSLAVPTLRDYIREGGLPCFKVRGKLLVKKSEFDRWMEGFRAHKTKDVKAIADSIMESLKRGKSDKQSAGQKR